MRSLLTAENIQKAYRKHAIVVPVLQGLDLEVEAGEFLSLVGASGSGKTTLLHLLGLLDKPDEGSITFDGKRIDNLPSRGRDQLRNGTFGFIFQFYHLLPELNVVENVLMPSMIRQSVFTWWGERGKLRKRALELVERVGLGHRMKHKPNELSGGEMQRAAIARSLMNRPRVLLADEPTGNLDAATGNEIVKLLRDLNHDDGLTIIMVTHNWDLATTADRVVRMAQGRLEDAHALQPA